MQFILRRRVNVRGPFNFQSRGLGYNRRQQYALSHSGQAKGTDSAFSQKPNLIRTKETLVTDVARQVFAQFSLAGHLAYTPMRVCWKQVRRN